MKNAPLTPRFSDQQPNHWGYRLDRVLLLAPGVYVVGLFMRSDELLGWSLAWWAVCFPICSLATIWRVTGRNPPCDGWRGVATLVSGGASWFLTPLLLTPPLAPFAPKLAFPLVFIPQATAMARVTWFQSPVSPKGRAVRIWIAVAACLAWLAVWSLVVVAAVRRVGGGILGAPIGVIAAVLALLALALGVGLARSARRGLHPPRPPRPPDVHADFERL